MRRFRIKVVSKSAVIRLTIVAIVLLLLTIWAWFLMLRMPGKSYSTQQLPPLQEKEIVLQQLLQQDVQMLASTIGSRNIDRLENLNRAKTFLETSLTQSGYEVNQQEYRANNKTFYNLEVERLGTEKPEEIIAIGGHYDTAFSSPGANDNGTGAAATLELARIFAQKSTKRTIRFVEFTNEEPPFFWTKNMGSLIYAKQAHQRKEKIVAMLSLETMGYFSDLENSQKYPFPLDLFYPDRGNFISFVGNVGSRKLVRKAIKAFRDRAQFPSEGAALPGWIPGVGWSDQWSFWQQGYEGIMVTDTAPYRYPYYHTERDTLDKIDFDKLARVTAGLARVISDLAE